MNTNFQPSEDTFDDVSGHGISSGRIDGPDAEDTEGHGGRLPVEAEDTEGHGGKFPVEAEDTEGHGFRGNIEASDDDDTEGHGIRVKV